MELIYFPLWEIEAEGIWTDMKSDASKQTFTYNVLHICKTLLLQIILQLLQ